MKQLFNISILVLFIALSVILFILYKASPAYNYSVLETGNVIMMVLAFSSFMLINKQAGKNGSAFVRGVSGSSLLKLMVCMISVVIYAAVNRANVHKPSIFILMAIYAIYSATETILLSRMARTMK